MAQEITIVRWTIGAAAKNFDIDAKTLSSHLKACGILPGEDDSFCTLDICKAIYGDLKGNLIREQTKKTIEERIKLARENAVADGDLLPKDILVKALEAALVPVRELILNTQDIPQARRIEIVESCRTANINEIIADHSNSEADDSEGEE